MATPSYEEAKRYVEALPSAEQRRLLTELAAQLSQPGCDEPRNLLELEGLGQELWQGTDVDEYLRQERSSWNG